MYRCFLSFDISFHILTILASCSCSNFISSTTGYGKCIKDYFGSPICYVNEPSACTDVVTADSTGPTGYSWQACELHGFVG